MKEVLSLKRQDAEALQDFARRVRERLGPLLVSLKLFGSKATGKDVHESDIDVLVVVQTASVSVEDQVLDIAFQVNLEHEVYISPRVIDRAVLDDPVWKMTPFLKALEKEGVPV